MARILVVHATTHGHTGKIAARIAHGLRVDGHAVHELSDIAHSGQDIKGFDAVIVGGSIHRGHHQPELVAWAERHRTSLGLVPSAFFSVCLTAADDSDESRQVTQDYLDEFEERTGWTPALRTTFAGALQYREYDFATRLVMRLSMRRGGHPTDIRHDVEYTDWDAVDVFTRACAALASRTTAHVS